jgi:hypothetical protein
MDKTNDRTMQVHKVIDGVQISMAGEPIDISGYGGRDE